MVNPILASKFAFLFSSSSQSVSITELLQLSSCSGDSGWYIGMTLLYCLVFVIASLADLHLNNISLFGIDLLEILS